MQKRLRQRVDELRRRRDRLVMELLLALPPTATVLATLLLLEAVAQRRVLFPSLAASAFLIYRDPMHAMNGACVTVAGHLVGVVLGIGAWAALHPGNLAGAGALAATDGVLILGEVVHPPAVSTALGFAFFPAEADAVGWFVIALMVLAALVVVQRGITWAAHARRPGTRFSTRSR